MKIYLPNFSKQSIGGGWTFLRNFKKYAERLGHEVVDYQSAGYNSPETVILISGATMVSREFIKEAKAVGKKIILRVDNVPRNSRNRNTGTSRLYDFAQAADLVIYQSEWVRGFLMPFLKKEGPVILNGADTEIFKPNGSIRPADGNPQCLFLQYNRDETKQWYRAWYEFMTMIRQHPDAHLWLVGNFSPELQKFQFDLFGGAEKRYDYLGALENPEDVAEVMRGAKNLLIPYFNDACSNTLIEWRLCHAENVMAIFCDRSGGTPEILESPLEKLTAEFMTKRYIEEIEKIL